jgi:2'-5' RNA ligase
LYLNLNSLVSLSKGNSNFSAIRDLYLLIFLYNGNHMSTTKSYRIFIGAYPSGQLAEKLQELRQYYDPKTAAISDPHVTLAGSYWRSGPPVEQNETTAIASLKTVCAGNQPFELHLGGLRTFPPPHNPVIFLAVERTPALLAIRRSLLAVLGHDKKRRFVPHLTLAMRLKGPAARVMLQDLKGSQWDVTTQHVQINTLYLMLRARQDPAWRGIARLPLQKQG